MSFKNLNQILAISSIFGLSLFAFTLAIPNPSNAAQISVLLVDSSFSPKTITIQTGNTVIWTNMGMMAHTVTADGGSFDSGSISPGAQFSRTFNTPGTFPYHCAFHGAAGGIGMSGTVIVVEMPGSTSNQTYTSTAPAASSTTPEMTTPTSPTSTPTSTAPMTTVPTTTAPTISGLELNAAWSGTSVIQPNQTAKFFAQIMNSSSSTASGLIDLEVVNATGTQMAQKFFDNVSFSPWQIQTFNIDTPSNLPAGVYYLSVGIYNPGWNGLIQWNDKAAPLAVQALNSSADIILLSSSLSTSSSTSSNSSTTFSAVIDTTDSSSPRTVLVDLELFNQNNRQIAQHFFDNVTLPPSQTFTLASPSGLPDGNYRFDIGIFNPGWSGLLHWYWNAQTFTIGTASTSTPTSTENTISASTPTSTENTATSTGSGM